MTDINNVLIELLASILAIKIHPDPDINITDKGFKYLCWMIQDICDKNNISIKDIGDKNFDRNN